MTESVSKKGFAAIVAAGGSGTRFSQDSVQETGTALPKQFLTLKGRPLYFWSLRELILNNSIDNIVMVAPTQILDDLRQQLNEIRRELATTKTIAVIEGGGSRQESVFKGMLYLKKLDRQPEYVLIHDAARPLLTRLIAL